MNLVLARSPLFIVKRLVSIFDKHLLLLFRYLCIEVSFHIASLEMFHLNDDKFISFKNVKELDYVAPSDHVSHYGRLTFQSTYLLRVEHRLVDYLQGIRFPWF